MIERKQDLLLRQAEQLGQVLGVILGKLLGVDKRIQEQASLIATNKLLKEEVDFDINDLLAIPSAEFIESLKFNYHFNDSSIESIAEILFLTGDSEVPLVKKQLFERSLLLYNYLESLPTKTFSFSRIGKIQQLQNALYNKI